MSMTLQELLNKQARVVVPILPPRAGEVTVSINGGAYSFIAYSADSTTVFHIGDAVRVTDISYTRTVFVEAI